MHLKLFGLARRKERDVQGVVMLANDAYAGDGWCRAQSHQKITKREVELEGKFNVVN